MFQEFLHGNKSSSYGPCTLPTSVFEHRQSLHFHANFRLPRRTKYTRSNGHKPIAEYGFYFIHTRARSRVVINIGVLLFLFRLTILRRLPRRSPGRTPRAYAETTKRLFADPRTRAKASRSKSPVRKPRYRQKNAETRCPRSGDSRRRRERETPS